MPEQTPARRASGGQVAAGVTRRDRWAGRHYTPELLGGMCAGGCGQLVPAALADDRHPTCVDDMPDLVRRDKIRRASERRTRDTG